MLGAGRRLRWVSVGSLLLACTLTVTIGGFADPLATAAPASVAAAVSSDPVVVAAGDIACGPDDPRFNGRDPSACQMGATARLAASLAPSYLLPMGDNQYLAHQPQGTEPTLAAYRAGYGGSWAHIGDNLPGLKVRPVPGNHEYGDLSENSAPPLAAAANYFSYFGAAGLGYLPSNVTSPSNDWYSYDVPVVNGLAWHVVALDSECAALPKGSASGGCAAGSPMESWLAQDLALHQGQCTIAYWHEPRWAWGSGGSEPGPNFDALWRDLVRYGAVAALNGHDHYYQHWAPMGADGQPAAGGVSEFIVGTGGVNHEPVAGSLPKGVLAQDGTEFGVLSLTLHATGASYQFLTTAGVVRDQGTLSCSKGAATPVVTGVTPISGASGGGTTVTVTGSGFRPDATVAFGSTPASAVTVLSSTRLSVVAPAGSRTVDVRVTSGGVASPVTVADEYTYTLSSGFTAQLSATTTSPAAAGQVVLSATSSKALSSTAGLTIYDASTQQVLTRAISGTTASATVSRTGAATHRYVAYVDNGAGGGLVAMSIPVIVTWQAAPSSVPTVSSVTPVSGPSTGGTPVTISGTGFTSGATVSFGGRPGTSVTVQSSTSILATAPADERTVDVQVTTAGGTSAVSAADEFTNTFAKNGYGATLAASATRPAVGGSVTLTATADQDMGPTDYGMSIVDVTTGQNLVHVGSGTKATAVVSQQAASTHRYVAQIDSIKGYPTQAVSTPIVVTWQTTAPTGGPTVSAVAPVSGPSTGGTRVTISGTGFTSGATVSFGGSPGTSVTVQSSTSILATAPADERTVDVQVTTAGGTSAVSALDEFTNTFAKNGYGATLAASATRPAVGGSVTLTATANQDMGPTDYGMSIVDVTTGQNLVHIGGGTTATAVVSQQAASTHRYVARIDSINGYPTQAVSTPIIVTWG